MITGSCLSRASAVSALILFSQAAHAQPTQASPSTTAPNTAPVGNTETTAAATAPDAATSNVPTAVAENVAPSGEIVVTAQRRTQQLQKVPLTVTALSATQLEAAGVSQVVDLSGFVPNVAVRVQANGVQLFMRGVGSNTGASPGDEPSISTYVDGMYNPFGASVAAYALPSIQRIEVLKGPQGTLFGRNSTGGVIQIITKDPSTEHFSGEASIGYANFETLTAKAYVSAPLGHTLGLGITFYHDKQSKGYGRNITLGTETFRHDDTDLRAKLLWTPTPTTEIRLIGEYHHYKSDAPQFQLAQGVISPRNGSTYPGKYNTQGNFDELNRLNDYSLSAKVDQDLGSLHFANQLTYRWYRNQTRQDLDTVAVPFLNADLFGRANVLTNETQLFGPKGSKLDWLIGAFYFRMDGGYHPFHEEGQATGAQPFLDVITNQKIDSFAIYGQATYSVTDSTRVTVGLRNTWEDRRFDGRIEGAGHAVITGPIVAFKSYSKPTWRLALAQDFTPAINGYVSYNRGIKSGGFSMTSPTTPGYDPEQIDAYEIGLKAQLFDRVLTLNPALFHYKYKDIQVRQNKEGSNIVRNAAAAENEGFDLDYSIRPGGGFSVTGGIGYLWKAKFTDYVGAQANAMNGATTFIDATGNRLINAPKWTVSSQAQYQTPVAPETSLTFAFGGAYESSSFTQPDNRFKYPKHLLLNGSVAVDWRNFEGRLWMTNITNKEYYSYRSEGTFGDFQVRGAPRSYGVTLSATY
jgi:iron complex outermembrane receptor protein